MSAVSRQCVILIGGLGTRLGEIVKDCPKPLLEVNGKPFLDHIIANLARYGFDKFVLLAGYKKELVQELYSDSSRFRNRNISITVVPEYTQLGTAGALKNAEEFLDEEFLLLNGDSVFDFNVLDLAVSFGDADWLAKMAVRNVSDTGRYGTVEISNNQVTNFREKTADNSPGTVNAGVYWLKKSILDYVKAAPCSLENEVFPVLVEKALIWGREYDGAFLDIGIPEDLSKAGDFISSLEKRRAIFFDRDGTLNKDEGYTHKSEGFEWVSGAIQAIKRFNDLGYYVFVITNQAGIARGFYQDADVENLHHWMNDSLRVYGAHIDEFVYCPHHPEGVVDGLAIACDCRKPEPGLIKQLLENWKIQPSASYVVGDKDSDVKAAAACDLQGLLFDGSDLDSFVRENILNGTQ